MVAGQGGVPVSSVSDAEHAEQSLERVAPRFPEIGLEFSVGGVPLAELDLMALPLDQAQQLWNELQRVGGLELAGLALTHRDLTSYRSISPTEYRLLGDQLEGRFFVRDAGWASGADLREVTAVVPQRLVEMQAASIELLRNPAWRAEKERLLVETVRGQTGFDPDTLAFEPRRLGTKLELVDPYGRVVASHVSSVVGWP